MSNSRSGRRRFAIALVAASFAVAGCGRAAVEPTPSPTPSFPVTPTPTPTLSAGAQAAVDKAFAFNNMIDRLASDPSLSLNEIVTVARDPAADVWRRQLAVYRQNGWRETGSVVLTLDGVEPGQDAREWLVRLCLDVTDADVVDKNGVSVVEEDRLPRALTTHTVTQDPQTLEWYVTDLIGAGPCPAP